jgi:hypothetical protein
MKPWCDQFKRQLFEAEYLADEDSVFVPARLLTNSENNFITLTETTLNGIYTCRNPNTDQGRGSERLCGPGMARLGRLCPGGIL